MESLLEIVPRLFRVLLNNTPLPICHLRLSAAVISTYATAPAAATAAAAVRAQQPVISIPRRPSVALSFGFSPPLRFNLHQSARSVVGPARPGGPPNRRQQ